MNRSLPIHLATLVAVALSLFACRDPSPTKAAVSVGDPIVDVIRKLGVPENQCGMPGLMLAEERPAFGLQWGIDEDAPVLPGDIFAAEITVWFDQHGTVVDVER